jgi:hypothetical protein
MEINMSKNFSSLGMSLNMAVLLSGAAGYGQVEGLGNVILERLREKVNPGEFGVVSVRGGSG